MSNMMPPKQHKNISDFIHSLLFKKAGKRIIYFSKIYQTRQ